MNIENKLYDLYSDLVKEKFGSDLSFYEETAIRKKRMTSCAHCRFDCEIFEDKGIYRNPLNSKWFVVENEEDMEGTMTEINLYSLGLSDDQYFATEEEAFEHLRENGLCYEY